MPTAPDAPELARPPKRGRWMSELAAVEEVRVWRPCATDLGFWTEVRAARVAAVQAEGRPVLASGCGAVSTLLAEPGTVEVRPPRGNRYQAAGAE